MELWRLVAVHAPVAFGQREARPGDRLWRAVVAVASMKDAQLESLMRQESDHVGVFGAGG